MNGFSLGDIFVTFKAKTDDLKKGADDIKSLTDQATDGTSKITQFTEKYGSALNKTAAAVGVVAVAVGAYAKNATDFTVQYVKDAKNISRITGENIATSSELVHVVEKLGIGADNAAQVFGIFAKNIQNAADAAGSQKIQQEKLQQQIKETELSISQQGDTIKQTQSTLKNQIDATNISITATTDNIKKNGDASGKLHNELEALQLKLKDLKRQYDDTSSSTGTSALATSNLEVKLKDLKDQLTATTSPFQKLGISVTDTNGKTKGFNDLLLEVADKFKAMPDGIQKTDLALQLFGRSGKDMIKVLNQGSGGIQDLEREADKLGLTLNAQTVGNVAKYIAATKQLKDTSDSLKIAVGTLTSPYLTAFKQGINDVLLKLIAVDSPLRGATAGFIAFSPPILSGLGSVTAFAANIEQALPIIASMAGTLRAVIAVLEGPWGIAIAAAGLAIGVFVAWLFGHKQQNDSTSASVRQLTADIEAQKNAVEDASAKFSDAMLSQKGAALDVEQAQKNLNDAVSNFGPDSLEAREAAHNLEVANASLRDRTQEAANAHDNLRSAENKLKDDQAKAQEAIQARTSKFVDMGNTVDGVNGKINSLDTIIKNISGSPGLAKLQNLNIGGIAGKRAAGGPVDYAKPYLVGERGPEIFVPNSSGQIVPNDKVGSKMEINGNIYIDSPQDADYFFARADRNLLLARGGGSPV
jgi:predicted nuclease with TOPRIM domain